MLISEAPSLPCACARLQANLWVGEWGGGEELLLLLCASALQAPSQFVPHPAVDQVLVTALLPPALHPL